MDGEYKMLIDGELVDQKEGRFGVVNPATGDIFAWCPTATLELTEHAVAAASEAYAKWKDTEVADRRHCLLKALRTFKAHADDLAMLLCMEQGKPLSEAYSEIESCYPMFGKCAYQDVETVDNYEGTNKHTVHTRRVPLGVCALITPWNYPIFTAVQKLCPAIMTGNTVVLKPSPFTPLSSLLLGALFKNVFPKGVFNVLTGLDAGAFALGRYLTNHPQVAKISFTGSTVTGRKIMQAACTNFKRITLEMGGNDAAIVRPDVDITEAAEGVFKSAFANTGALCCAIKRVYVHESIFRPFVEEMVRLAVSAKTGDSFSENVEYGPVNNEQQYNRGVVLVEDARTRGAEIECGGERIGHEGYFYKPTIITNVTDSTRIVREEQFFPALPILSYSTDDEAVKRANDTPYGLGGSVWSKDVAMATKMAHRLRVGTSWVNCHSDLTGGEFGGRVGSSGFGRELGKADLYAFTESQTLMIPRVVEKLNRVIAS